VVERYVLGLTSYQEALRAVGRLAGRASEVGIVEHPEEGWLELTLGGSPRRIDAAELENIVVSSLAQRGEHRGAGDTADVLRAVGLALDELHALGVALTLTPDRLSVEFGDRHALSHELTYAGEELEALRRAAAARRNGQPLRRVLILQADADSVAPLVELLVAEFAIQALPTPYARAIAATAEPPDLVLAQATSETLAAVRTLRSGRRTVGVPIVVIVDGECATDTGDFFAAGVDDLLQVPVLPAQLRARIRTALLRGRSDSPNAAQ
jgi:CheY-like chemotaxis protein